MFLRGLGGNAAQLGHQQNDAIRNITGNLGNIAFGGGSSSVGTFAIDPREAWIFGSGDASKYFIKSISFNASNVVPTANENRPVNYAVQYCIKY
jgi:hypothetical protein